MKILKFKTNINCAGCIATIAPHLNGLKDITKWQVETTDPKKVLTVETSVLEPEQIVKIVNKAGFKAESL